MKIEEYKKTPNFCLFCDSDDLTGEVPGVDQTGKITSMVTCVTCRKKWIEVYQVVDIISLDKE